LQIEKRRPQIIRIALHPRDPKEEIKDQKEMISILKDSDYEISTYTEIIPNLLRRISSFNTTGLNNIIPIS
jgi:hypothetical protein